jgi:uncharacterized protein YciI
MPLYVVFYETNPDAVGLIPDQYPAHRARLDEFHARGELMLVGPFGDPITEGAMSVFRSREGAEEFVADDPFVTSGVVARWYLREWHEAFSEQ